MAAQDVVTIASRMLTPLHKLNGIALNPMPKVLKLRYLDFAVFFVGRVPWPDQSSEEKGGPRDPPYKLAQLQKPKARPRAELYSAWPGFTSPLASG